MSISFQVKTDREQERQQKEGTLQKVLRDHFPHWVVSSRFKHHPDYSLFPGLYCGTINSTDKWLSLIASAYFEKWMHEGIMKSYGVCGGWDPRWHTATRNWYGVDPVQWVTDTYGDTLENQFPKLSEVYDGRTWEHIVDTRDAAFLPTFTLQPAIAPFPVAVLENGHYCARESDISASVKVWSKERNRNSADSYIFLWMDNMGIPYKRIEFFDNAQGRFVEWESDGREFHLAPYQEWM